MTNDFAIDILEQYREKPTLVNEIKTVEEAVWLDEALDISIKAITAIDAIKAEIAHEISLHNHTWFRGGMIYCLNIIDKHIGK